MSLTSSSEKDLLEAAKKIGLLQRDRLGNQGNTFEWFQRMEAILRSHSLYHIVAPNDKREREKRILLMVVVGKDEQKKAKLKLDLMNAEDKVMALLETPVAPDLLSKIRGKAPAQP